MNNIDNLIEILENIGGSASTQEIAQQYCQSRKMVLDSSYTSLISNVLNNNKNLVYYSSLINKWALLQQQSDFNILRVSEDRYFRDIKQVMRDVFNKNKVPPQHGYLEIDDQRFAWFPKFDNPDWKNELVDGKIFKQTSLKGELKPDDGKLRCTFLKEKNGYKFVGVFKYKETQGITNIYEIVDDKVMIETKRKPLILCRIAWMNEYKGISDTDIPSGAGEFVDKNNDAFEKYNFLLRENNEYYGFVETKETKKGSGIYNTITLENIDYTSNNKDSVSGVTVIFVSPNPNRDNKLTIVGWYENATVYRERQNINGEAYMMTTSDAHLIAVDDRTFEIPRTYNNRFVIGQSDFAYIQQYHEFKTLENKIIKYIDSVKKKDSINFFFEPINLNEWNMFKEIKSVGHEEYLLATKSMKVGDYILLHVGQQKSDVNSGVYAIAQIIENPAIYNGNEDEYCNGKLSVKTKIIKYSNIPLLSHKDCENYITQYRSVHQINSLYNDELYNLLINNFDTFKKYLEDKIAVGKIGKSTMDSYIASINYMSKNWVGKYLPDPIYEIKNIEFLKSLYSKLMDKNTEIGEINHRGKFMKSSAIKAYYEYLESNNIE